MNKAMAILAGAGVGAGLMFMLDPERGRRRRALVRDKAVGTWNTASRTVRGKSKDVANRTRGVVASTRSMLGSRVQDHRRAEAQAAQGERGGGFLMATWPPAARVAAGAAGGALAIYGWRRGKLIGKAASALGTSLVARSVRNPHREAA